MRRSNESPNSVAYWRPRTTAYHDVRGDDGRQWVSAGSTRVYLRPRGATSLSLHCHGFLSLELPKLSPDRSHLTPAQGWVREKTHLLFIVTSWLS